MASTINVALKVGVSGGPGISVTKSLSVEAFDMVSVAIASGAADTEVEIQPGATSRVQVFMIKASEYGANLSYKVHEAAATPIVLDQEHLFLGQGAVGLLGQHLDRLFFTNNLAHDVAVEILVGRDATP